MLHDLDDSALWGRQITDERYLTITRLNNNAASNGIRRQPAAVRSPIVIGVSRRIMVHQRRLLTARITTRWDW